MDFLQLLANAARTPLSWVSPLRILQRFATEFQDDAAELRLGLRAGWKQASCKKTINGGGPGVNPRVAYPTGGACASQLCKFRVISESLTFGACAKLISVVCLKEAGLRPPGVSIGPDEETEISKENKSVVPRRAPHSPGWPMARLFVFFAKGGWNQVPV